MMINEHDRVVLTVDSPDFSLQMGDVGTVVHIYGDHEACEVEFFTLHGQTVDVVTIESAHVRPARSTEILHARAMS